MTTKKKRILKEIITQMRFKKLEKRITELEKKVDKLENLLS
jgi:polyhydroxyalkanoate synthesis regulator phasin